MITQNTNPHLNLAFEEALLLAPPSVPTLFLWQNANTVVIGRNQNAWGECHIAHIQQDQCLLARRTTGGGAVFHDMGNLNFSFIMPRDIYDLQTQTKVLCQALLSLGISAAFQGRNDLVVDGRKCSGNAFRFTPSAGLHHGTLLIRADFARMARYLNVSKAKMQAKGIASVPARVMNLCEVKADISTADVMDALFGSFMNTYGICAIETLAPQTIDHAALTQRNASWDWNYAQSPAMQYISSHRFEWGEVTLHFNVRQGHICDLSLFSDALDPDLPPAAARALENCAFEPSALESALSPWADLSAWGATLFE